MTLGETSGYYTMHDCSPLLLPRVAFLPESPAASPQCLLVSGSLPATSETVATLPHLALEILHACNHYTAQ